jgi:hypothetical protein
MKETEKLELALSGLDLSILHIEYGDTLSTQEEIAKMIRKSIISIRRGEGRDIDLTY